MTLHLIVTLAFFDLELPPTNNFRVVLYHPANTLEQMRGRSSQSKAYLREFLHYDNNLTRVGTLLKHRHFYNQELV